MNKILKILFLLLATSTYAHANEPAGIIIKHEGLVQIHNKDGHIRLAKSGDTIYQSEAISTAGQGKALIQLIDGEKMLIKPSSHLVINRIHQEESGRYHSIKTLLWGKIRLITGKAGKSRHDTYETRTPVAVLGVRGTEYAIAMCHGQECRHDNGIMQQGLHLSVVKGEIVSQSSHSKINIRAGEHYHQPAAHKAPVKIKHQDGAVLHDNDQAYLQAK